MPDLNAAQRDLREHLGNYLDRHRQTGVFHLQPGGPATVPALQDLGLPELHLDLLPRTPTPEQQSALHTLGYVPAGPHTWTHPGGWHLILCDHGSGWRAQQGTLRDLLLADPDAASMYRATYQQRGRNAADTALQAAALTHHAHTVGLAPAHHVARLLTPLNAPWMFAAGTALDLHLGCVARPHDDLDVIIPRNAQLQLLPLLRDWRLDVPIDGTYHPFTQSIEPPHHQIHARNPDLPGVQLLDLLLTDLSRDTWHYRRDPRITLPLDRARRLSPEGLPYLTPEAVLLFKASTAGRDPRGKDEADFQRVRPTLNEDARAWLRDALTLARPDHPWLQGL
ncbi:hypothetical protein LAJ19_02885 [Deinococcus taeanensis]|uniref:hypothetical protein n=1 Tax=Deinococcus taeanensis TaxID=2737050 RepID=UPI001CDC3B9E|nr:hypothetical protein [Deinococcus taeanensis]UBV43184.1 hypothetical protein LAJ19_02885 [Deinococcus taeanensis]